MSYQLPDLLTFLTSVLHPSSSSGDLHINPSYNPNLFLTLSPQNPTLQNLLLLHHPTTNEKKIRKLQKTPRELIEEYNPGLLACVYLPFTSILRGGWEDEEVVRVLWEWLCVCVLVGEEIVRPGRVVGVGVGDDFRGCLEEIGKRLSKFSNDQTMHDDVVNEIINASNNPPPKPHSTNNNNHITQYLNWRIDLSGHRIISKLFLSPNHHQYTRAIELALQIIICVTDLFAYNIHQAWHTNDTSSQTHLNLISFLLQGGGGGRDSEILTLQAAINMTGEMIRQRMVQLQTELYHKGNQHEGEGGKSGGGLANIFTSFFTATTNNDDNKTEKPDGDDEDSEEIRTTIWNWVTGIIHWAYEVEYFSPDLDEDGGEKNKKKKKGGEIRDYGWVFLIPKETP